MTSYSSARSLTASIRAKAITAAILRDVFEVFRGFRYVREIGGSGDSRDHALVFEARVGELDLTGCDFVRLDGEERIDRPMVMVRSMRAAEALVEEMVGRFDRVYARAPD